jgi:succinate dehydrogenase / fumarate reductase cytochrome b subunit
MDQPAVLPRAFVWRRMHSLTGMLFVIFLMEHLFVNSQAALTADGSGFITTVNAIYHLPFLRVLEILLIALPITIHTIWGVVYAWQGKSNSTNSDGTKPALPEYGRNHAYTWQRVTAWILVIAILAHVIHMRFVEYPASAHPTDIRASKEEVFMVRMQDDAATQAMADKLDVELFTAEEIALAKAAWERSQKPITSGQAADSQELDQQGWFEALESRPLAVDEVMAVTPDFGTAELLMVRESFKMPVMIALYTIFVITACYHAFNGVWTFLISWGITMSATAQRYSLYVCYGMMLIFTFLGLAAIWGSYWINLNALG